LSNTESAAFEAPIVGYPDSVGIGQRFGTRNPAHSNDHHVADDISGIANVTVVSAIGAGTVMFISGQERSNCDDNWGHVLVIEHPLPDGTHLNSIYAHLNPDSISVEEGMPVFEGQPLGTIGSYPSCWNDHLHFGTRVGSFDFPVGQYPTWLKGYLTPAQFPGTYVDPQVVLATPPPFSFALDSFSIDGNIAGSGNADGISDFFDDFNDGRLDVPPTSLLAFSQGRAATTESGGFLQFTDSDGTFVRPIGGGVFQAFDDMKTGAIFTNGAGSSVITAVYRAQETQMGEAYSLGLASQQDPSQETAVVFVRMETTPSGTFISAGNEIQTFASIPVNLAQVSRVHLRASLDTMNNITLSFSLNGTSFTNLVTLPNAIFTVGSTAFAFAQGSVVFE